MSDNFLQVIPSTPTFMPDGDAAQAAEALLRTLLPDAERISDRKEDAVAFIDAGANLEHVLCSSCGRDLLASGAWQQLMGAAWEARFSHLEAVVPCCGSSTSLNDLQYDWPCGFATYVLEARNPGRTLTAHEVAELSSVLGCNIRVIHSHV